MVVFAGTASRPDGVLNAGRNIADLPRFPKPGKMADHYLLSRLLAAEPVLNRLRRRIMDRRYMDARETAAFLNMSLSWVYRDSARCGLRGYKFGSGRNAKIQFEVNEVKRWADQRRMP